MNLKTKEQLKNGAGFCAVMSVPVLLILVPFIKMFLTYSLFGMLELFWNIFLGMSIFIVCAFGLILGIWIFSKAGEFKMGSSAVVVEPLSKRLGLTEKMFSKETFSRLISGCGKLVGAYIIFMVILFLLFGIIQGWALIFGKNLIP